MDEDIMESTVSERSKEPAPTNSTSKDNEASEQ